MRGGGQQTRGFTLLEVMVAMAILAMGLTMVLSSQAGLLSATKRVQAETHAASLMRCKMSEVELDLLEGGYPLIEQNDSGECCEDDDSDFSCEWTIQTIELPQPTQFDIGDGEGPLGDDGDGDADPLAGASPFGTPLGDAQALSDGSALTGVAGMGDLAGTLGESAEGGGMIGMALSLVYPTLKPMLEASIRKVKVAVIWNEGSKERRFEAVQYVTNPLEGGLNPNAAEELGDIVNLLETGTVDGGSGDSDGDEP